MCRRVTCPKCNKPSWAGCGAHVESVLYDVPKADRCQCRESGAATDASEGFLAKLKQLFRG
jgi:hypothetical protein